MSFDFDELQTFATAPGFEVEEIRRVYQRAAGMLLLRKPLTSESLRFGLETFLSPQ